MKKWSTFLSSGWLYIFFVLEFPQFWGETRILFEKREFTIGDKRKKMAAYPTINWKIEIDRGQIRWFNNKGHGLVSCYQKKSRQTTSLNFTDSWDKGSSPEDQRRFHRDWQIRWIFCKLLTLGQFCLEHLQGHDVYDDHPDRTDEKYLFKQTYEIKIISWRKS